MKGRIRVHPFERLGVADQSHCGWSRGQHGVVKIDAGVSINNAEVSTLCLLRTSRSTAFDVMFDVGYESIDPGAVVISRP
jgi:hypothetical protein